MLLRFYSEFKTNKTDSRKYISEAVSNLKGLTIETFDAEFGRPSLINFDNQRVFEGNDL